MKIQETLVNKDEGVHLLNYKSERKSKDFRRHLGLIYVLLLVSFGLHLYVIIIGSSGHFTTTSKTKASSASTASSEAILIKERGRRHALQGIIHKPRGQIFGYF